LPRGILELELKKIVLTDQDKDDLMLGVSHLLDISFKVRQNGFYYIEDEIKNLDDEFLKLAYRLVADGYELESSRHILCNFIDSSHTSDIDYVRMCMQLDTILMMAEKPVHFVNMALFSYFGLNYRDRYIAKLKELSPNYHLFGIFYILGNPVELSEDGYGTV